MSDSPKFTPPAPSVEHRVLAKDVGTWDAEVVAHIPGGPPQRSTGVSEGRLACGGRWLILDYRSEGSDFEGHGVYGYDPQKQKYVGTWVDTMRTSLVTMEGTWDAEKRTMTFVGEAPTPQGTMRWRETTESVDDVTRRFQVVMLGPDGAETVAMTTTYRRR
jgi:hypothetical protein